VWLVKGKAVEDSQDARQEVLLPAYRVTGKPEVVERTSQLPVCRPLVHNHPIPFNAFSTDYNDAHGWH
jgi:hypothetical protein